MKSTPWNPDGISFGDIYGTGRKPKEVKATVFVVWCKVFGAYINEEGLIEFTVKKAKKFNTETDAKAFISKANRQKSWIVKKK